MDRDMAASVGFMSRSAAIRWRAGAMIVDTMIRLKPVAERTLVTVHFCRSGHCMGFSASWGSAKVTMRDGWAASLDFDVEGRGPSSMSVLGGETAGDSDLWISCEAAMVKE